MAGSLEAYEKIIAALEANLNWVNTVSYGEPQLGKRGLYASLGVQKTVIARDQDRAMMWLLNLADGKHDLLSIAERSGISVELLVSVAAKLEGSMLLVKRSCERLEKS
jgi:aminopeptidase-like protein